MRRLSGVLLAAIGVLLLGLGLLFLVGAAGQARRLAIGVVGLGLGAVAVGGGVRFFRDAEAASPERLEAAILELARRRNGELTMTDVRAGLGRHAAAGAAVVDALVAAGTCRRSSKGGDEWLVFPSLQPRLMTRICEYCAAELPVSEAAAKCPNCGGVLATKVAARSASEGTLFAMDE